MAVKAVGMCICDMNCDDIIMCMVVVVVVHYGDQAFVYSQELLCIFSSFCHGLGHVAIDIPFICC